MIANLYAFKTLPTSQFGLSLLSWVEGLAKLNVVNINIFVLLLFSTAVAAADGGVVDDDGDGDASQRRSLFYIKTCNLRR